MCKAPQEWSLSVLISTIEINLNFLTNTKLKHKMCHRTTWTGPERRNEFKDKNGEIRRNPFRNQIDYILIKRTNHL